VHAGHLDAGRRIETLMLGLIDDPLNPVNRQTLSADLSFREFAAGDVLTPGPGVRIRTAPLIHPNGAIGYRVEFGGHSVCYVTDTEHNKNALDLNVLGLIEGADYLIYDATYTDAEYPRYAGWGHSTWQEGVRLCNQADAELLVIFHHDPTHDDRFMDQVAADAEKARPGTVVAREGMVLRP